MTTAGIKTLDYLKTILPLFRERLVSYQVSEVAGVLILSDSSGDPINSMEVYPELTEAEVKNIETKLGFTLHAEFRDLLLHINGGRFFQDLNIWGIRKIYSKDEYLDQNFDLVLDQQERREGWEQRIWRESDLIVGDDGMGNLIVLNNDNGKVTYLDNEFPDETNEDEFGSIINYLDEYLEEYVSNVIGQ